MMSIRLGANSDLKKWFHLFEDHPWSDCEEGRQNGANARRTASAILSGRHDPDIDVHGGSKITVGSQCVGTDEEEFNLFVGQGE